MLFLFFLCKTITTNINRMPNSWRQGLFGCFEDRDTCEYFTFYCTYNKVMGKKLRFYFWARIFFSRDKGTMGWGRPISVCPGTFRDCAFYWRSYYLPCLIIFTYNVRYFGAFLEPPTYPKNVHHLWKFPFVSLQYLI